MFDQIPALAVLLAALGLVSYLAAVGVRPASTATPGGKNASDVLMALGTALIASGALAIVTGIYQDELTAAREEAATVAAQARDRETRLLMTADLSGYDPGPEDPERGIVNGHSGRCFEPWKLIRPRTDLRARYLAAKTLNGARLGGLNLGGADFRDTRLRGAILACSRLSGASLQHADLSYADLGGATLQGADLRGASMSRAALPRRMGALAGAKVNAATCWPETMRPGDVRDRNLTPWPMDNPRQPPALGHICGTRTLILATGRAVATSGLPAANGEKQTSRAVRAIATASPTQLIPGQAETTSSMPTEP